MKQCKYSVLNEMRKIPFEASLCVCWSPPTPLLRLLGRLIPQRKCQTRKARLHRYTLELYCIFDALRTRDIQPSAKNMKISLCSCIIALRFFCNVDRHIYLLFTQTYEDGE
ncbi:hypothetical protein MTR67_011528 [Solanum verrucosum]|uniref:Uncharacterized protein n=1 Tax=Solanum verrucosum TaxID=315347 RepID=A0AAF0TJA9_SOLVR|nr:hypothetical protein MTR67_011528 [Solanum verrucosum]